MEKGHRKRSPNKTTLSITGRERLFAFHPTFSVTTGFHQRRGEITFSQDRRITTAGQSRLKDIKLRQKLERLDIKEVRFPLRVSRNQKKESARPKKNEPVSKRMRKRSLDF